MEELFTYRFGYLKKTSYYIIKVTGRLRAGQVEYLDYIDSCFDVRQFGFVDDIIYAKPIPWKSAASRTIKWMLESEQFATYRKCKIEKVVMTREMIAESRWETATSRDYDQVEDPFEWWNDARFYF